MKTFSGKQFDKTVNYIISLIHQEKFAVGSKLPSENAIATTLNVSRVTVRRALKQLNIDGVIKIVKGKGSYVNEVPGNNSDMLIPFITSQADLQSRFFEIYNGVQDCLKNANIKAILTIANWNFDQERDAVIDFYNKGYRHMLIMSGFSDKNLFFYHEMIQNGVNFVFIDKKPNMLTCDCVSSDNFSGGYIATEHLFKLGHKKIAVCAYETANMASTLQDRINGYKFSLIKNNIPFDENLFFQVNEGGVEGLAERLLNSELSPTSVFCLSDTLALPLTNFFVRKGIEMPIMGFDNLPGTESNHPSISTVEQPFYNLGYTAAQAICDRIATPNLPLRLSVLPVKLIVRDSTTYQLKKDLDPINA